MSERRDSGGFFDEFGGAIFGLALIILGLLVWSVVCSPAHASQPTFTRVQVDPSAQPALVEKCLGDIDGDGRLDVVVGQQNSQGYGGSGIYWYRNPGGTAGSWVKRTIASSGQAYEDCRVEDIDGDGKNDVIASYVGTVSWFRNPGALTGSWTRTIIGQSGGENCLRYADLDGDGSPDLITEDKMFFRQPGGGWFEWAYNPSGFRGVALLDIGSGKGAINLVGTDPSGAHNVIWWENPRETGGNARTGQWIKHTIGPGYPCSSCPQYDVANYDACDVTGDGLMDVIAVQAEGVDFSAPPPGGLIYFKRIGDPRSASGWQRITIDGSYINSHNIVCADMGTGRNSLVGAEQDQARESTPAGTATPTGRVSIFWNGASGWTRQDLATTAGHQVQVADIEGDGDLDVVSAPHGFFLQTPNRISVDLWLNQSAGAAQPSKAEALVRGW